MQFPDIFGLPAHPLIVHATVVMVPLAATAVALHAFVPRARVRLGLVTVAFAVLATALVPLSTSSGEQLQKDLGNNALIERHSQLADGLLPWVIGILVVAVLLAVRDFVVRRRHDLSDGGKGRSAVGLVTKPVVLMVLAAAVFAGTAQQVVRIGHSGAEATWQGVTSGQGG